MPDLIIPGATDLPPEPKPQETVSKPEDASLIAKERDELRQKYEAVEKIAQNAVKRAEGAEGYISQLTASLQEAAARASQPGQQQVDVDPRDMLAENPSAFLDRHFAERAAPLVQGVAENQARLNREVAFSKFTGQKIEGTDKSLAEVYGKEVDDFMANMPPGTRAEAGAYDAAMQWVRSKHVDQEVAMRYEAKVEGEKRTFVESPTAAPGTQRAAKTLSDIEKQVAKGLGIAEDDYLKYRDMEA